MGEGTRRAMLAGVATAVTTAAASRAFGRKDKAKHDKHGEHEGEEEGVGPGEDLMREHGVLRRVMLVHDEAIRRIDAGEAVPAAALAAGAGIIRKVIQDYHEKLEEEFLFPRFEQAKKLVELVATLREQHRAGRAVVDAVAKLAGPASRSKSEAKAVRAELVAFNRMYRPHAAREDTILFPAFHELVGEKAYRKLGEQFEEREEKALGEEGFEGAVREVAALETELGIADLARFTPRP
jgi:hemerythrin-like domain-containing protein